MCMNCDNHELTRIQLIQFYRTDLQEVSESDHPDGLRFDTDRALSWFWLCRLGEATGSTRRFSGPAPVKLVVLVCFAW